MNHDMSDCCTGKVKCKKPFSSCDVKTECIFVEKVFDSRIFKTQQIVDCCPCPIEIDKEIVKIIEDSVKVKCRVIKFEPTIETLKINGQMIDLCDFDNVVKGPGGMEQINLKGLDIDFKNCLEKNKGVKVNIKQKLSIDSKIKIMVSGKGIKMNDCGCPEKVCFTGEDVIECCFENIRCKFDDMCMPNNNAVFPVLIGDICASNCKFELDDIELVNDCDCDSDQVKLFGELIFCIKCEKKIKFPVELCVLSTGYCEQPEVDCGGCNEDDFPDLFPVAYKDGCCPNICVNEEKVKFSQAIEDCLDCNDTDPYLDLDALKDKEEF